MYTIQLIRGMSKLMPPLYSRTFHLEARLIPSDNLVSMIIALHDCIPQTITPILLLANHHVSPVELATDFFRQPVTVLLYNDADKKMAGIFASQAITTNPVSTAAAPTTPDLPNVNHGAARTRAKTATLRLLGIRSAHRTRLGALKALLERLEDVIGQSMVGAPVETTRGYVIERDWIL